MADPKFLKELRRLQTKVRNHTATVRELEKHRRFTDEIIAEYKREHREWLDAQIDEIEAKFPGARAQILGG